MVDPSELWSLDSKKVRLFVAVLQMLALVLRATAQILGPFATSLCAELIRPNGYTCDEYSVPTQDGFLLGLQNIHPSQPGPINYTSRPAVVLQHGVLAAGSDFVVNSPLESLGFILADAGFDVWIANNRNVQWSHGHVTYVSADFRYWDWTSDELSSFDLVASVGFAYNHTGGNKVFYVGHSQGTLMLLAGLTGGAFKNEVLGYLRGAILLAPGAYVTNIMAPIPKAGLRIYADQILPLIGLGEFNQQIFVNIACLNIPLNITTTCNSVLTGILGSNRYLNESRLPFYTNYYPQPTSSFNINHVGQSFRTNVFQFYDKGLLGNHASYGQDTPPQYKLEDFPSSLPLQIFTGGIDELADPLDVATLLAKLPSTNRNVINLPSYGHVDFIYGVRAYLDVYPALIDFIKQH